jgi:primase-polymerase (primpol)-like protein
MAKSNDPRTLTTYEEACDWYAESGNPTMFCLLPEDPLFGFDLDDCVDPITGEIAPWARAIIERLNTRTTFSSSGKGIHCIGYGTKPGTRCQHGKDGGPGGFTGGIYSHNRFIALTDDVVPGYPSQIRDCQAALNALYGELFPEPARNPATGVIDPGASLDDYGREQSPPLTDRQIFNKLATAPNAPKFRRLWSGDDTDYRHDVSSGDAAFLAQIAFYTQNRDQILRIALQSDRNRDKWGREDYLRRTLDFVLSVQRERYGVDTASRLVWHPDGTVALVARHTGAGR